MGKLYVVGFGPGDEGGMTATCKQRLQVSDVIVGYSQYISLLRPLFPEKNFYETGMTREIDRCRAAIELAIEGKTVSVVSSGDSGIYGMAGIIFELAENELTKSSPRLEIEVIGGVTAAASGAALLGAPIGHDFAAISLSDLLTPWEVIEKRLRSAADGDFIICLYNPGSKQRAGYTGIACNILLETLPPERPCGIARNIGRADQSTALLTLGELSRREVGMSETVFIGNSQTKNIAGFLVTPRGYLHD
jgi:precorrin-3B C17-methyltransferase